MPLKIKPGILQWLIRVPTLFLYYLFSIVYFVFIFFSCLLIIFFVVFIFCPPIFFPSSFTTYFNLVFSSLKTNIHSSSVIPVFNLILVLYASQLIYYFFSQNFFSSFVSYYYTMSCLSMSLFIMGLSRLILVIVYLYYVLNLDNYYFFLSSFYLLFTYRRLLLFFRYNYTIERNNFFSIVCLSMYVSFSSSIDFFKEQTFFSLLLLYIYLL